MYPWIHTANWAFAVPSATVGGSPSATDGENFAVFLLRLCRVLGAHGELANSGSAGTIDRRKRRTAIRNETSAHGEWLQFGLLNK